jgi:hypothetical protein
MSSEPKKPLSEEKILDRVKKFIALTASDHEEEARTSALIACRLIREHGLVVMGKVAYKVPSAAPRGQRREHWADPPSSSYAWSGDEYRYKQQPSDPADMSGVGRGDFTTDTAILTHKQFRTAIEQSFQYKAGIPTAYQFFSRMEVEKSKGNGVARAMLGILKEILAKS